MTASEIRDEYMKVVLPHRRAAYKPGMRCEDGCPCESDAGIIASVLAELLNKDPLTASLDDWDEAIGIAIDAWSIDDEDD